MKLKPLVFIPLLFCASSAFAKVDVSPLFVQLSDAMAESKKGEIAKSQQNLTALQQDFLKLEQKNSEKGELVNTALEQAIKTPDSPHLETLARALYAFEKEQNPVDHQGKHQDFVSKMHPLYETLAQAVKTKDIWKIKVAYRDVGLNWVKQEKAMREISLKHYGQFERTLGLLRITLKEDNPELAKIEERVAELGKLMADFNQFKVK